MTLLTFIRSMLVGRLLDLVYWIAPEDEKTAVAKAILVYAQTMHLRFTGKTAS